MKKTANKEQSKGEIDLTDEQKSQSRVTVLSTAVIKSIKEASNGMQDLTFNEITVVLSTALLSYAKRGIQAQFPQTET